MGACLLWVARLGADPPPGPPEPRGQRAKVGPPLLRLSEVMRLSSTTYRQISYWAQKGWLGAAIQLVDQNLPLQMSPVLEASSTARQWEGPAVVILDDLDQPIGGRPRVWPWNAVLRASLIRLLVDAGLSLRTARLAAVEYPDHLDDWLHLDAATRDLRWATKPGRFPHGAWFDASQLHADAWRAYLAGAEPPWTAPPDIIA